ncbi:MAG: SRPBCC domain-containing protein [Hyphomicrobiales bacterium]
MSNSIHQEVMFKAKPSEVYAALMELRKHAAFTKNGAAKISKKVGGAFSAHGGYVAGINLDLVENKRIVQAWRAKNWPKGVYSIVSFQFSKAGSGTKLTLDHTGIPEGQSDHLAGGWQKMYWDRLTEYFA